LASVLFFFHSFFGNIFRLIDQHAIRNYERIGFRYVGEHLNNCRHNNSLNSGFWKYIGSIFLKKGNIKIGLIIGLTGFFFFALTSIPAAEFLFQGKNLNLDKVIGWLPWILPIVFLNGVREELLYRGLFLKKFEGKLGLKTSNLLQAVIFSLSHSVAGVGLNAYTPFIWVLVIFTFSLGLIWGYTMQRTNSVIGSILFHAGTDIPVFIGIFSNLF